MPTERYPRYVLAVDESGQSSIRHPASGRAFMFGGVVIPEAEIARFRRIWREITSTMPLLQNGNKPRTAGDVKAIDFSEHYAPKHQDDEQKAHWGMAVFSILAKELHMLPLVISIKKNEAGTELLSRTNKGGDAIDLTGLIPLLIAAFGAFLNRNKSYGFVCMDHLRSPKEEAEFSLRWKTDVEGSKRISRELRFENSADFPEIQAADVLLGLLRGQHEKQWALPRGMTDFLRRGEAAGLFVIHLS